MLAMSPLTLALYAAQDEAAEARALGMRHPTRRRELFAKAAKAMRDAEALIELIAKTCTTRANRAQRMAA